MEWRWRSAFKDNVATPMALRGGIEWDEFWLAFSIGQYPRGHGPTMTDTAKFELLCVSFNTAYTLKLLCTLCVYTCTKVCGIIGFHFYVFVDLWSLIFFLTS